MMRVLIINSVCGIRSTGRICADLAEQLIADGHQVRIAYGRVASVPEKYGNIAVRIGNGLDLYLHALRARLSDASGFGSRKATETFLGWVKEYDPDLIHLHNLHGYYLNVEVLFDYLKQSGKKVIWTLHDSWAFSGHSGTCDASGCTRWKEGCYDCPMRKEYPKSFADHSQANWKRKKELFSGVKDLSIVVPTKQMKQNVLQSFLKEYECSIIPNGIDLNVFRPVQSDFRKRYGLNGMQMILAAASTWNKAKGLDDLMKLAKMLDEDQKLVILGLDEKQRKEMPGTVIALPLIDDTEELAKIYSSADLFVNPTYSDLYPSVNLEAQACGTPVACYNSGGCSETLYQGSYLVNKGDIEAMRGIIVSCKGKNKDFDHLQLLSSDRNRCAEKYIRMYKEATGQI